MCRTQPLSGLCCLVALPHLLTKLKHMVRLLGNICDRFLESILKQFDKHEKLF